MIHGIIKESSYHYLIVWKGEDENGQPWDDWWGAKGEANAAAKRDWATLRASEAKDQRKKRKEFQAMEEERWKAKGESRVSNKGRSGGRE